MARVAKNLVKSRDEYTRYFGSFAGVDFSSDHTEVSDNRLAYLKNMYKDYQSGQGQAIETIPGFRRIHEPGGTVNGVHTYRAHRGGNEIVRILVHLGDKLYVYDENFYPYGDLLSGNLIAGPEKLTKISDDKSTSFMYGGLMYILDGNTMLSYNGRAAQEVQTYTPTTYISAATAGTTLQPSKYAESSSGTTVVSYVRGKYTAMKGLAEQASTGVEHEQRNLLSPWYKMTFVALDNDMTNCFQLNTTATAESTPNNNADAKNEVSFPQKIHVDQYGVKLPWAWYGEETDEDGNSIDPYLVPEGYPNAVVRVCANGIVELVKAPPAPEKNDWNPDEKRGDYAGFEYPTGYAGIEITVYKPFNSVGGESFSYSGDGSTTASGSPIVGCTIGVTYDNRHFLTGHPKFPNLVFYSMINSKTGRCDPTYFGELNIIPIGIGNAPITALLPIADTLMVLRRDTVQDGSVAFLSGQVTGEDLITKIYTVTQGLPGYGCLGACCNFLDDPIFISKLGVEAMGQLSVRYERAVEHRSSLIDAALLNCDLKKADIVEWGGYMLVLIEGKIFMADSRQRFTHKSGVVQYEWYYLEDIGVYDGQYERYVYARYPHEGLVGMMIGELPLTEDMSLLGQTANPQTEDGADPENILSYTDDEGNVIYYVERDGEAVFCEPAGSVEKEIFYNEYIGGTFDPAMKLFTVGEDLYFVTRGGVICKFNFDKRDPQTRVIPNRWYSFDGRAIESGAAVKMDNCGVPHLTKTTVRKSTVIKTRSNAKSTAKIYVRTNKDPFKQVDRLIGGAASFVDMDFMDLTFGSENEDKSLFTVSEREKGWVEKQYYVKSDEFMKPFALYYIVYCYYIAGRYKD